MRNCLVSICLGCVEIVELRVQDITVVGTLERVGYGYFACFQDRSISFIPHTLHTTLCKHISTRILGMQRNHAYKQPKAASSPQKVKTFASGTLLSGEYGALSGFARELTDESTFKPQSTVPDERRKKVIIVGGGINGIQQASIFLENGSVGINDIQIFDTLDDFGGVWQKNKYPGCACDVPAMVYTTSYNINKGTEFGSVLFH